MVTSYKEVIELIQLRYASNSINREHNLIKLFIMMKVINSDEMSREQIKRNKNNTITLDMLSC